MAEISKITLPNGNNYDLKVYTNHISPYQKRIYESTDYYATAANQNSSTWYFMSVRPDDWYKVWRVSFKLHTYCPNHPNVNSITFSTISGRQNGFTYMNFNDFDSTGHYYISCYPLTTAGYNAGYGHAIGNSILSASNYTTKSYYRTFEVDLIQTQNCTVTFLETPVKWTQWEGTGTTNYGSLVNLTAAGRGLQQTGDSNDPNYQNRIYYSSAWKTYTPLYRYQILLQKSENELLPVNSVNDTTSTTKTLTTESFNPFGEIFYYNTTTNYTTAGATITTNAVLYRQIHNLDLRYSFNKGSTLTAWKRVYIVAQLQQDGSAVLASSPIVQDLPAADDGYIYILLGHAINTTNIELYYNHPVYRFKNGKLQVLTEQVQVNQNAFSNIKVGSTTVAADTETDTLELVAGSNVTLTPDATNDKVTIAATDTTYQSKAAENGGTAVSLVTTGQKYIWNNKTSNTGTVTSVAVSNDTNGGLTVSGSPITSSGTVKIKHTNQVTAQNTQAIYPIKIDVNGHISAYGNAVTPLTASSTLDATKLSGTIPTACLPSYVDDVLEYTAKANFPATGQAGKIYVDKTTNLTWRWSGSTYVQISPSLALGTTSSTAFRGDYGNTAYTHAVTNKGSAFSSGLYKITTNSEGHVTAATAVQKSDITGLGIPGDAGVTGVKGNAESSYRSGQVNLTAGNIGAFEKKSYDTGTLEAGIRPYVDQARANRLAFLPADQIIIEKTTDGGTTWEDAGISDASKCGLFVTGGTMNIPLLNGAKSTQCGVRITITGMKYNVPEGTVETEKYNYWNATNVVRAERYFNVREWWFWLSSNNDAIRPQIYRATGANPNNWTSVFNTDFAMTGWSGSDWIRAGDGASFGGSITQTGNYWNWRIIFWSRYANGKTSFGSNTVQTIQQIRCYGDSVWTMSNNLGKNDHIYSYNASQNVTFPAKVTATAFNGNATSATNLLAYSGNEVTVGANNSSAGSSTNDSVWINYKDILGGTTSNGATKLIHYYFGNRKGTTSNVTIHAETFDGNLTGSATKVNNHTVNSDVPANAVFTDTKNTAGSTDTSSKIFLIGATSQAANPQTYSHDTAYVGTDGNLYSNGKVVLTGGSNAASAVTITPITTDVYSMTSAGSVTLPTLTFAMDTTDTKKLKITFGQGSVTLPGRSSVIKAWTGYTTATAAAQTFTGNSEPGVDSSSSDIVGEGLVDYMTLKQ